MVNCTDEKAPLAKTKQIGKILSDAFHLNEVPFCASVSVGIAMFPDHGITFTQLYKSADDALYEVKRRGKNGYALLNNTGEYSYSDFNTSEEI